MQRAKNRAFALLLLAAVTISGAGQTAQPKTPVSRLIFEVFINGEQMNYLTLLSDQIGSRLTGTAGARRAEELMEAEMKRIGLENVSREAYSIPTSWERGSARAWLPGYGDRPINIASYTWSPGTAGVVSGHVVNAGSGTIEELQKLGPGLKGAIILVSPAGATLDEVIRNFYYTPAMAHMLKEAGAVALMIASDKQNSLLYTAPVDFNARMAALPSLSISKEDVGLLQRLLASGKAVQMSLNVQNKIGPAINATNVVGEIRGAEIPDEIVVVGAHLDSNDLGPGALDNGAGCSAVLETARAIKALGLKPRRTIRFVLFTGEEEGMLGSTAYVKKHADEMDRTVAALIMDVGAGKPLGWFSMGRTDLDAELKELMRPLSQFGVGAIEHTAFAATDNAAFMAEGIPNLVMLQDETAYFPVHHTMSDTPDKADPKDFATCVAALAATSFAIADQEKRFGKRLDRDTVRKMASETKVEEQWKAAGIW